MNPSAASPIEKSVVLVGAGNAHLVFIRRWGMRPVPGVAVTLVNEASVDPLLGDGPRPHRRRISLGRDHHRSGASVPIGQGPLRAGTRAGDRPGGTRASSSPAGRRSFTTLSPSASARCPLARPDDAAAADSSLVHAAARRPAPPDRSRWRSSCGRRSAAVSSCRRRRRRERLRAGAGHSQAPGPTSGFRLTLLQGNARLLPEFPAGGARAFERSVPSSAASPSAERPRDRRRGGLVCAGRRRDASPVTRSSGRRRRRRSALRDSGCRWTPPASCACATRSSRSATRPSSAPATA